MGGDDGGRAAARDYDWTFGHGGRNQVKQTAKTTKMMRQKMKKKEKREREP